jgi:thioredoxin 1
MAKEFNTSNFEEEVLQSKQAVLIDFGRDGADPELSIEYNGKVTIGNVDVDKYPLIAGKYGIMNILAILFIRNGQVVEKIKGTAPKKNS